MNDNELSICDPKYCTRYNPQLITHPDQIYHEWRTHNEGNELLTQVLATLEEFTVIGEFWGLSKYLRDGYYTQGTVKITFVKSKDRFGVLRNDNHIWIYHNGTKEFCDEKFPKLCKYFFTNKNRNDEKGVDKDALQHVKILFNHEIFEDFVHTGKGVIIKNEELKRILVESENKT